LLTTILAIWLWGRQTKGVVRWVGISSFLAVVVLLGVRQMPIYVALASLACVMMGVGMVQAWRTGWSLRWLGVVMFSAVVLQGVLGGLRVVWARDEIGVFHAALAQAFPALLAMIMMMTGRWWLGLDVSPEGKESVGTGRPSRLLNRLLLTATVLVFFQLLIGATMRHQHAGLAIPDFPLAYGAVWPDMSADAVVRYNQQRIEMVAQNPITSGQIGLQMAHRIVALIIVGLVVWCGFVVRQSFARGHEMRRLAHFWVLLIGIQFALGVWTIWSNKAADIASLHVLCGALSLVTGGILCVVSLRLCARRAPRQEASQTNLNAALSGTEAGVMAAN
jgi:cytochrome c oxidase assembly protein subunit 15